MFSSDLAVRHAVHAPETVNARVSTLNGDGSIGRAGAGRRNSVQGSALPGGRLSFEAIRGTAMDRPVRPRVVRRRAAPAGPPVGI